jgi:hypothetical protein
MKTKTKKPVKTKAAKAAKVSPGAKLLRKICEGEIEHYRREVDAWAHDKEQRHVCLPKIISGRNGGAAQTRLGWLQ